MRRLCARQNRHPGSRVQSGFDPVALVIICRVRVELPRLSDAPTFGHSESDACFQAADLLASALLYLIVSTRHALNCRPTHTCMGTTASLPGVFASGCVRSVRAHGPRPLARVRAGLYWLEVFLGWPVHPQPKPMRKSSASCSRRPHVCFSCHVRGKPSGHGK
jgi:hypothetical protein